jgi:hypothetical protein
MPTGSSGTLIGCKSNQTLFVPLWDRKEGAWLWTPISRSCRAASRAAVTFRGHMTYIRMATFASGKLTATRFGMYLRYPWTDFGHFFNFENPSSIFDKIY